MVQIGQAKVLDMQALFYHLKKLVKTANKDKDKTVVLKCILTRKVKKENKSSCSSFG